jgi:hypothetical protein
VLEADLVRIAPQLLLKVECGVARSLRVILVSDRRAEERFAGVLVYGPFKAVNAVGEDREEPIEDLVPLLWINLLGQVHRALNVGEQNRHLLALALESAARGEDLLGEVLGV